ncbi:hypothetical protein [Paucibacter soli]|uniref:hypothetical protein n=1 Tax=Paucibacter soli TaxID=3133433 RepID=UPI0030ACF63A
MNPHSIFITTWSPGDTFEFELTPATTLRHPGPESGVLIDSQPVFEATVSLVKNYPNGDGELLEKVKLTGEQWLDFRENLNVPGFMKDIQESGHTGLKGHIQKNLMPGPVDNPHYLANAVMSLMGSGFAAIGYTMMSTEGDERVRRCHIAVDYIDENDARFAWNVGTTEVTPICAQTSPKRVSSHSPSGFHYNIRPGGQFSVSMSCNTPAEAALAIKLFTQPDSPDGKVRGPMSYSKADLAALLSSLGQAAAPGARNRPRPQ